MSLHDEVNEQPRKRQRLTGPDEGGSESAPVASVAVEEKEVAISTEDAVKAQLEQEEKAGITVYASGASGFLGVVKKRYTDFLVNEILPSGQVLHLEELAAPKQRQRSEGKAATEATSAGAAAAAVPAENGSTKAENAAVEPASNGVDPSRAEQISAEEKEEFTSEERKDAAIAAILPGDMAALTDIFGEKTTKDICSLYGKMVARPDKKARDYDRMQSAVIADKQARTDAHIAVRRIFNSMIETQTADDNTILIKAAPKPNLHNPRSLPHKGAGARPKGKVGWDELGGEHLHFTLYKENKDTMEVLGFIGSQLKIPGKNFQFAGTKDRRGVTCQRVSAYRIAADRLVGLNPKLRQAKLGGFQYNPTGLELGDLHGNQFTITLRDCQFPNEPASRPERLELAKRVVSEAMTNFISGGYINYYGLQRFGSFAIGTDIVGKKMLQGDYQSAVASILTYSPDALSAAQNPDPSLKISQDDVARAEAIHIWETTSKMGGALDRLPRRFQAENAIIRHLGWTDRRTGEQPRKRDFQGALQMIARNLRLMYVHAYQSLVWNMVAGQRRKLYGGTVVEGDLVLVSEHAEAEQEPEEDEDENGEIIIRPAKDDSAAALDDKFERARPLSKAEAESGKFTIFDIVLPLPGFDVEYPANAVGDYYKEFMGSERGGGLNPKDMRRKWRDISLSGSYRKLMARPVNVAHEVRPYTKDDEQMVQTDLEKLLGKEGAAQAGGLAEPANGGDVDMAGDGESVDKIAVVIKMQLGSSQYATMALRELTKGGAVTYKPDFQGAR
ncbi:hypothetical protein MBLNU459_g5989t1 [Dothideomycetes sp. NU459]